MYGNRSDAFLRSLERNQLTRPQQRRVQDDDDEEYDGDAPNPFSNSYGDTDQDADRVAAFRGRNSMHQMIIGRDNGRGNYRTDSARAALLQNQERRAYMARRAALNNEQQRMGRALMSVEDFANDDDEATYEMRRQRMMRHAAALSRMEDSAEIGRTPDDMDGDEANDIREDSDGEGMEVEELRDEDIALSNYTKWVKVLDDQIEQQKGESGPASMMNVGGNLGMHVSDDSKFWSLLDFVTRYNYPHNYQERLEIDKSLENDKVLIEHMQTKQRMQRGWMNAVSFEECEVKFEEKYEDLSAD